jgi:hypothetical protein
MELDMFQESGDTINHGLYTMYKCILWICVPYLFEKIRQICIFLPILSAILKNVYLSYLYLNFRTFFIKISDKLKDI